DEKLAALQSEEHERGAARTAVVRELASLTGVVSDKEQALGNAETALFELGSRTEHVKSALVEALALEAALKNEQGGIARQRDVCESKRSRLKEEHGSLEILGGKLTQDIETAGARLDDIIRALQTAEGGKETASARVSNALARKAEAERRFESCRADLTAVGSRHASIKELSESFEGYGDGVRKFMSNGGRERAGALGVVAELIDI